MKNFNNSIRSSIKFLHEVELLMQAGNPNSLSASTEFKKIAKRAINYQEVYDAGIRLQEFNVLLEDRSYFQFSIEQAHEEIRLAYYPNPYKYTKFKDQKIVINNLIDEGFSYEEINQLISEDILSHDIPYIRMDISKQQYCENFHPFAHFHIGFYTENRWPVKRLLSPFAFVLFILNHYYVSFCKDLIDKNIVNFLDIYQSEVNKCPILTEEFFKEHQEKRLYFT